MGKYTNLKAKKTYSKAEEINSKENFRKKLKKPVPKFEDLYISNNKNRKEKECLINTPTLKKHGQRSPKFESSPELFSTDDSFDAIANSDMKNRDKLIPLKEFEAMISSESSSGSLHNEGFLSMFESNLKIDTLISPEKCEDMMRLDVINTPTIPQLKISEAASVCPKEGHLASLSLNVITSTPTIQDVKDCSSNSTDILKNKLSPIEKSSLFNIVDDSYVSEADFNQKMKEISLCDNNFSVDIFESEPSSNNVKSKQISHTNTVTQMSLFNTPKSSKTRIKSLSQNVSNSFYGDSFSAFLNLKPTRFQRITQRKKFTGPGNLTRLYCTSKTSLQSPSFRKKSCSTVILEKSEIQSKMFCSSSDGNSVKDSFAFSVTLIKGGKGYKRSIKKLLSDTKLQLSLSSSMRQITTTSYFDNQTATLFQKDFREEVLRLCFQDEELKMEEFFNEELIKSSKKIGEGVYGEVFLFNKPDGSKNVLKVMPIEGEQVINGERQKTFEEMMPEIMISRCLNNLRSNRENNCSTFVFLNNSHLLIGNYNSELLKLWDEYNEKKESENDRPDSFPPNQLFLGLEYSFAGEDLEKFVFNNAKQAFSIWLQVAHALSVSEEVYEFEHRDLHWGNVLVAKTSETTLKYLLKGKEYSIKTHGLMANIIDYTLSRLKCEDRIYFNDLSQDPDLFISQGDYQFEVYRMMQKSNGNNWCDFTPITNVYWLHYLLLKILNDCYYKNTNTKIHKETLKELRMLSHKILTHNSASELVLMLNR